MRAPRPTTGPRSPTIGGFSLVELLAVLSVTAILAAVAIPRLAAASDARHAAAARLALRDLTQARERAVATAVPVWIAFDLQAQAYTLAAENPTAPGRAGATPLTDPATGAPWRRTLNTGELAGARLLAADFGGAPAVGFDWLGRALTASEAPLPSRGSLTFTGGHTVTVEPTGAIAASPAP